MTQKLYPADHPTYKPPSEQTAQLPVAKPGEPIPQEVLDQLPTSGTGGGDGGWSPGEGPPDWPGKPPEEQDALSVPTKPKRTTASARRGK